MRERVHVLFNVVLQFLKDTQFGLVESDIFGTWSCNMIGMREGEVEES